MKRGLYVVVAVAICAVGCGEDSDTGDVDVGETGGTSNNGTGGGTTATTTRSSGTTSTGGGTTDSDTTTGGNSTTSMTGGSTGATTGGSTTTMTTTGPDVDPVEVLCQEVCERGAACLGALCEPDWASGMVDGCVADCVALSPPERDALAMLACDDIEDEACADGAEGQAFCDCPEPMQTLGGPCVSDLECQGSEGRAELSCQPESDPETGRPTGYVGGYCIQTDCESDDDCGVGNVCSFMLMGQVCLAGCVPDNGAEDCREGYGCWALGGMLGACLPQCTSDADCGVGGVCDRDNTRACL